MRARTIGRPRRVGARARKASCQAVMSRWLRRTGRSVRVSAASVLDRPLLASRTEVNGSGCATCGSSCDDGNMTDGVAVACQPRDSRHQSVYCVQPDRDACRAEIMHHGPVPRSSAFGRHVSELINDVLRPLSSPSPTPSLPTLPYTHSLLPFSLLSIFGRPGRSASPLLGDPPPHHSSRSASSFLHPLSLIPVSGGP